MTKTPVPLSAANIAKVSNEIARPNYTPADLRPGIVHIGVGNFHRAHQAWYLHRLMNEGMARDWAIVGAGVRPGDGVMRDKLLAQDCLTTLIELRPGGTSAEICGAMIDFVPVDPDNAALIAKLADPAIRIVSLTVTEGGYFVNPATGAFDPTHPDMVHDAKHPDKPRTAFGGIIAALRLRRDAGAGPFTVQSCDNLWGNGDITRDTILGLARLSDTQLADWIGQNCTFPNSMVDCIVPATGATEIAAARGFGIEDAAPVTHENYRQWVIEDAFCAGRPNWDRVGAIFTDKVRDYEAMKIRILNAGHQVLANVGELLGLTTIADCMADLDVSAYWRKVELEEIVPHVAAVPDMTPENYVRLIESRFSNPAIRDTTRRVAFDGSSRHTGFVLPILRDGLAANAPVSGLALVEALWARMCEGTREDGSPIAPNDPDWESLQTCAALARSRPSAWLEQKHIYGDLAGHTEFAAAFASWMNKIHTVGTRSTIRAYADGDVDG